MAKDNFTKLCEDNNYSQKEIDLFEQALEFVQTSLKDKKRISGEPAFSHNLRTGKILIENRSMPEVVLAGFLHGLPELNEEIKKKFGREVFSLIEGLNEIEQIKYKNKKLEAESLRKILLTTVKDFRVIFVKLANKLDNLASLDVLPKKDQTRIAQEVLDIYAPLAYRLGAEKIRTKLEDLAFKTINPRKYQEIVNFLEDSQEQREKNIQNFISFIKKEAKQKVEIIKIKGRSKHIYSIYKKIIGRKIKLNQQYDLLGVRIIVPEIKDCYNILGILHEKFEPLEGRLKDYIANPKPNFYRSIHTGIKLANGSKMEVQIRTPEMDDLAEEGLAAHWRYKGLSSSQSFEKKISWLKGILDLQKEVKSSEFLETAKVDIFGDKIYCYTPKGDLKELPKDSTILDFAYSVHEQVGNHTVGGRVNGKFVPLRYELKQGDVVEILTNKSQRPRRGWIKIVKSGKSRQKIRKSLKEFEKLPPLFYHKLKSIIKEDMGVLAESEEFPNATCVLAKCCNPVPGEDIVGIITKKRSISVHREDCRQALKEESRWIPVNWKETFNKKIRFFVNAHERSGLLADLLHTIANAGFEVKEAKAKLIDINHAECNFLVIPKDLEHLKELIIRVKKLKGIMNVYFE